MIYYKLTLILFLASFCAANDMQCPDSSQWKLRQSGICNKTHQSYFCLYDENLRKDVEFCGHKPDIQRPGYKFIVRGNLDGSPCNQSRYQPTKFWTNESNECIFKKSNCSEEGFVIHTEGNSTSDKTCRCDYTKGYAFVFRPKGKCFCDPIVEDCSCYKKPCNGSQVLTPDYNCIRTNEWTGIFDCMIIMKQKTQMKYKERKKTYTETDLPEMIKCDEEKVIVTATVICILMGFGMSMCLIIMYHKIHKWIYPAKKRMDAFQKWHDEEQSERLRCCLKENCNGIVATINNREIVDYLVVNKIFTMNDRQEVDECLGRRKKNQKLLEKLLQHGSKGYNVFMSALTNKEMYAELKSKIEGSKGLLSAKIEIQDDSNEKIPKKIRDAFETNVSDWNKDDKKFYITLGTEKVDEIIKEKNCVLVVGRSGNGKSAIIRHIALKHFNEDGYDIVPIVLDPNTILQYHNPNRKQIFVVDDFCGKVGINPQNVEIWSLHIDDILKLIINNQEHTDQTFGNGNVKLLFATVSGVSEDVLFNRIDCLFQFKFDLSDWPLQDKEKIGMIDKYLTREQMSDTLTSTLHRHEDIYPLLCKLSVGKSANQIIELFTNPNKVIRDDFLALEKTNKTQICLIACCVLLESLKGDVFRKEHIPGQDKVVIEAVCGEFDLDLRKESTRSKLDVELKYLEETYFVKTGDSYQLVHKKIYDIAAVICGDIISNIFIRSAPSSFIAERYSFVWTNKEERDNIIFIHNEETQKIYFDRLMTDLEQGITYSTFHNSQLIHKSYRDKFCKYCRDRKQKVVEILNQLQKSSSNPRTDTNEKATEISGDNVNEYEDYMEFSKSYHYSSHNMRIPLIESAWEGHEDIVDLLVEMARDLNETDKFGRSALFVACHLGKENVAILLLNKGANHELADNNEISPLYAACKGGYSTITDALLKKGADIFKSDKNGCCPLHAASETGHKTIVEKLLEAKNNENIDQCDHSGRSALFHASYHGKNNVVKLLLENHANINKCDKKGFSPLMAACTKGWYDVAEFLINKDADIFKTDNDRRSALYMACKKGHHKIVDVLLTKGADALQSDWHQRSPLFIASALGYEQIVSVLVNYNKSGISMIKQADEEGQSPLFIACEKGHKSIVHILLSSWPFEVLEQTDKSQRTPLYVACRGGYIEIVEMLVCKDAEIDHVNKWQATPLFAACREGHVDVVQYLIKKKADLELADSNGHTPLSVACDAGNVNIVRILVDNGSSINHRDNDKRVPLEIAQMRGHDNIAHILN